nr:unnamed protein product [Digitaria exilis]
MAGGVDGMVGDDGSGGSRGGGNGEDEIQIQIAGSSKPETSTRGTAPQNSHTKNWQWWLMVALNIFFLIAGQTASTLLGRFYYNQGGNSKWMSTFVQTAGFPVLFIVLFLFRSKSTQTTTSSPEISGTKITLIYIVLGLLIAADDLMYSYGLLYLPVSTYSLICASQLAFNAVFSYFLNDQKFTPFIFNSVILLTFSAALLGVDEDTQVFAVIFFHDKMDGVKIIAMLMAIWGFISYGYQLYVNDKKSRKTSVSVEENSTARKRACSGDQTDPLASAPAADPDRSRHHHHLPARHHHHHLPARHHHWTTGERRKAQLVNWRKEEQPSRWRSLCARYVSATDSAGRSDGTRARRSVNHTALASSNRSDPETESAQARGAPESSPSSPPSTAPPPTTRRRRRGRSRPSSRHG